MVGSFEVLALVALLGAASAADVAQSCVSGAPPGFDSVQVFVGDNECTAPPCALVRGQVARCLISFTTTSSVELLDQRINATTLGVTVPYPVPDAKKGCDKLTESFCPLDAGESATIELAFEVQKIYPKVSLELVIFLLDQQEKQVACFKMNGNVVD